MNSIRRFHRFTLLELFLLTAIIAILAAMLMPAVARAQSNTPPSILPPISNNGESVSNLLAQANNQTTATIVFNAALNLLPAWDPTQTNDFKSGEFTIESAPLWKAQTAAGTTPYNSTEADYFFTQNIGAGGELVSLGNGTGNAFLDSGRINFTLRKPVGNIAAYLLAGPGYEFSIKRYSFAGGPGIAYQYQTRVRLFVDLRYDFLIQDSKDSGWLTRVGLQLPF